MKVVYEQSITDRIAEFIKESKVDNKRIEYILLTAEEAIQLYDDCSFSYFY
jgi:hypothetical protein